MSKSNFKKEILDKLKKEKIEPKSKWQFLLKDYFVRFLGIISVLVGGVAVSVIIFTVMNSNWESYRFLSGSLLEHIIRTAPVFWIILLGTFIVFADYNFKHTKRGYKYSLTQVVGVSVLVSILLGIFFYQIGLSHITDKVFEKRLPGYMSVEKRKEMIFDHHPKENLLVGSVTLSERSDIWIFQEMNGREWEVVPIDLTEKDYFTLDNFEKVILIGEKIDETSFRACGVRPWEIIGGLKKRKNERKFMDMRNSMCGKGTTTLFAKPR